MMIRTLLAERTTESVLAFALIVHGWIVDRNTATLLTQEQGKLVAAGIQMSGKLVHVIRVIGTD